VKVLNKLKEKRGSALIFGMLIMSIAIFMTVLVVDFGMAYATRVQMQTVSDSMSLAGANYGAKDSYSITTDQTASYVEERDAKQKAEQIKRANQEHMADITRIVSTKYNPSRRIDGKTLSESGQYYSGNFTVELKTNMKTMLARAADWVSSMTIDTQSRTNVSSD
jgi:uncharacterized membrane protein